MEVFRSSFTSKLNSPISWGISWHRIATVVAMPVSTELEKAAPTTKPSAKLWRLSPTITITASSGMPRSGENGDNKMKLVCKDDDDDDDIQYTYSVAEQGRCRAPLVAFLNTLSPLKFSAHKFNRFT